MHIVTLRIQVPRNQRKIFLDAAQMVVGPTQVQPGCISCRFCQDLNDPDVVILVEEWQTRKELDRHFNSELYRIVLSLVDMSEKPPEFKLCTISKTEGLEALEAARERREFVRVGES
jgi:quinol monooxygenase YgiN